MKPISTSKSLLAGLALVAALPAAMAQQVFYNGASVYIQPGAHVYIQGGFTNQTGGSVTSDGTIHLTTDWQNNAANNVFVPGGAGTVVLEGTAQTIGGASSTQFVNLTLQNASVKTVAINTTVNGVLDLTDAEMEIGANTVTVTNPSVNAVTRTTGFVSMNTVGGGLVRATNTNAGYLFPMGSSAGVARYRPVTITPNNTNANDFEVGFRNVNPTTDNYNTLNAQSPVCYVNNDFYHLISRPNGSSAADVEISFDNVVDSAYTNVANYGSNWTDMGAVSLNSQTSPTLSTLTLTGVSTFTNDPYALTINTANNVIAALAGTTVCQGDSVGLQLQSSLTTGYQWYFNGGIINGATANTFYAKNTGNYTLMAGNGLCNATSNQISVTITPAPNPAITSTPSVCINSGVQTLTAATSGGTWSGTGITNPTTGTFDPSVVGVGTSAIKYKITGGGCSDSSIVTFTVNNIPNATFTAPQTTFCAADAAVNFTPALAGGTWSGTGINTSSGLFTPATVGSGSTTIGYQVTDNNNCTASSSQSITVNANPTVNFASVPALCPSSSPINLSATPSGGTWSGTGITDANNGTFDPSSITPGNVSVSYTSPAVNGCSTTASLTVPVTNNPNASFTSPATVCTNGSTVTLTPTTSGGTWSGTGVNASGIFDPNGLPIGNAAVTYTVGSGNCTGSSTVNINVVDIPNASFTAPQTTFCSQDAPANFTASVNGGSWTGVGINGSGLFTPSAVTGSSNITYTITDANNCTNSSSQLITVNTNPSVSFSSVQPFCAASTPFNLSATPTGGTWSGTGIADANNGTFDPSVVGAGNTANISYTVTVNGCAGTNTLSLPVTGLADASFTAPATICNTAAATTLTPVTAGGTWSGTSAVNATTGVFTPAGLPQGNVSVTYTVGTGVCQGSSTQTINVILGPTVVVNSASAQCSNGAPITLTATPSGGTWSGNGITGTSSGVFSPQAAGAGSQVITYTVTQNGCTNSAQTTVVVNALPNASFTNPSPLCQGGTAVSLVPNVSGGTFSGTGISAGGQFDPATSGVGTFTVTYNVTQNGCSNSQSQNVVVNPLPTASFSQSVGAGLTVNFTSFSQNATSVSWEFGDGTTGTGSPISHTYTAPGVYTVMLISSNGCGNDTTYKDLGVYYLGAEEVDPNAPQVKVYPSPFVASTGVEITLVSADEVAIEVYDMTGKLVGVKNNLSLSSGTTYVGLDETFFHAASANYFVHVRDSKGFTSIHKVIRLTNK